VIIGQEARASHHFSLLDLPSSSGRLDVLLRCLRAALLVSHGLRRDTSVYLVLQGGWGAPRTVRVEGERARFLRPDERSLAMLVRRVLAAPAEGEGFIERHPGVSVAQGGLDQVLADLGQATHYVLEEGAPDVRGQALEGPAPVFYLGDHRGFSVETRAWIAARGAKPIGVGPLSLHSDDALALVVNELDRRDPPGDDGPPRRDERGD
jgi:tRNA (pseudouridine54-N1)-methyltransferase